MSDILKDELTNDPLGRGYSGMTDEEAADDLNTIYATDPRTRSRVSMSATEVLNAVDPSEYNALISADKDRLWQLLGIGDLNPFGVEATLMVNLFGAGSTTITTLKAARVESITRVQELPGVRAPVKVGHIMVARAT